MTQFVVEQEPRLLVRLVDPGRREVIVHSRTLRKEHDSGEGGGVPGQHPGSLALDSAMSLVTLIDEPLGSIALGLETDHAYLTCGTLSTPLISLMRSATSSVTLSKTSPPAARSISVRFLKPCEPSFCSQSTPTHVASPSLPSLLANH